MARRPAVQTLLRWACSVFVAAGLGHGVFWLVAVRRLDALVEQQAQALRAQGWRVVLGPARPRGWPERAGLQFGPASVEADGFAWRADRAVIDAPLRWTEPMPGTLGPARVRADGQQVRFGSGAALAVVSQEWQLEVSGGAATLAGTDVGIAQAFEAGALQLRLGPDGLALSARRLRPPDSARMRGWGIDALALRASAATPPFPVAGGPRAAATAWRQAGGTVEVSDVTLTMGRAHAVGKGRIWLDDALQPRLDATMRVIGYEAGLDELAAAGVLTRPAAVAAKAILGLLAAPAPDGGATVPVQIADGMLTVARFPLLRVPALDWPDASPEP